MPKAAVRVDQVALTGSPLAPGVEVELILLFVAVAETLSFTRAAQNLKTDQSWLSHKIRQFERSLGVSLFLRNTRHVELTDAGRTLLETARRLADVAAQARDAAELLRHSMTGALRIGALPFSFPDAPRTALVDRFMQAHPEIQTLVVNGPTPELLAHLRGGRVDLAFVSAPIDARGLELLRLRATRYCLLMPETHALARLSSLAESDLAGERVILPSPQFSPEAYALYYRPLVEAGVVPVVVPEFQGAIPYALEWGLPTACTDHAAERCDARGWVRRPLAFVPACQKYLVRLAGHRTNAQRLFWNIARSAA